MPATKIFWGQIIIVSLIVLTTTWAATKWTALRLGFQSQLGEPWFELLGWPIYYPPAFFWWWYAYDAYGLKSFLIAQSLNQIEKAYGLNNSILDNCHVRVSCAINDESTAKRVSDALGTATELRAMKNYAGHRLSPWRGHLMVSRQATARSLLRPGEVMQLPPNDEIVMLAGTPPIRARKARYFEDQQFQTRMLTPPNLEQPMKRRADDWSAGPLPPRPDIADLEAQGNEDEASDTQHERRKQAELEQAHTPDATKPMDNEFEPDLKKTSTDHTAQLHLFDQQARQAAQRAALDPDHGIEL